MTQPRLGTVTIGQAPRPDLTPVLDAHVPAWVPRTHVGVLDGYAEAEIRQRFAPRPRHRTLATRLAAGQFVEVDAEAIEIGLRAKIKDLDEAGCTVIVVLCTGAFRNLRASRAWLIEPERVLPALVARLIGARRLGLVVPLEGQAEAERRKWSDLQIPPVVSVANPYVDDDAQVRTAVTELRRSGADAVLLDCFGFTARHRAVARAVGLPVLVSSSLVAHVAGACFAEEAIT